MHPVPAQHMLALLIRGSLHEARFLWRQLPEQCRQIRDVNVAWEAGKALWKRDWNSVYKVIQTHSWSPAVEKLAANLLHSTRRSVFDLLANAYSVIALKKVAFLLALPDDVAAQECISAGWTIEGAYVRPKPQQNNNAAVETPTGGRSLSELRALSEQLVRLQTSV